MDTKQGLAPLIRNATTIALFSLVFLGTAGIADATVGGPTYLYDFKYNPADESVYYVSASQSGRGCPPVLQMLSLRTNVSGDIFSCAQGEELLGRSGYQGGHPAALFQKFEDITRDFERLTHIHLPKNSVSIDLMFESTGGVSGAEAIHGWTNFRAVVYQNGEKITDFPMRGCNREQPFIFAGYAVPGVADKMILLSSGKTDCFEGGYIGEQLHVIENVAPLDTTYWSNFYKSNEPLVPSEVTLVVFEKDTVGRASRTVEDSKNKGGSVRADESVPPRVSGDITVFALVAVLFTALGVILGRTIFRGKSSLKDAGNSDMPTLHDNQGIGVVVWIIIAAVLIGGGYLAVQKSQVGSSEVQDQRKEPMRKEESASRNTSDGAPISEESETVGEFTGFYAPIRKSAWGETKTCDTLVVLDGTAGLVRYFSDMVRSGNTVQSLDEKGRLHITLDFRDIDESVRARIKNATESSPVKVRLQKKVQVGMDAPVCYSFFKILGVTGGQAQVAIRGWNTYRNERYGFEFEYPSDYYVSDVPRPSAGAPFLFIGPSSDSRAIDESHVRIYWPVDNDPAYHPSAQTLFEYKTSYDSRSFRVVVHAQEERTVNGFPSLRQIYSAGPWVEYFSGGRYDFKDEYATENGIRYVFFDNLKSFVILRGSRDVGLLDSIAATFRFINPTPSSAQKQTPTQSSVVPRLLSTSDWKEYKSSSNFIFDYPPSFTLVMEKTGPFLQFTSPLCDFLVLPITLDTVAEAKRLDDIGWKSAMLSDELKAGSRPLAATLRYNEGGALQLIQADGYLPGIRMVMGAKTESVLSTQCIDQFATILSTLVP
jgi:hypothetical protein